MKGASTPQTYHASGSLCWHVPGLFSSDKTPANYSSASIGITITKLLSPYF